MWPSNCVFSVEKISNEGISFRKWMIFPRTIKLNWFYTLIPYDNYFNLTKTNFQTIQFKNHKWRHLITIVGISCTWTCRTRDDLPWWLCNWKTIDAPLADNLIENIEMSNLVEIICEWVNSKWKTIAKKSVQHSMAKN